MAEAKIDMSAADRNVLALIQQIAKGFDKIAEAQGKVEVRSKEVAKTSESGFDKMVTGGARAVMAWVGVGSAIEAVRTGIRLATADYEHFNRQIERSRTAALGVAPAQTAAALAFTPDASAGSFAEIEKRVKGISEGQKIPQATVYQLSSEALGDRGTLSNVTAMTAVESTLKLAPNLKADEQSDITKAMLAAMNSYGVDAETAKGLIIQGAAEHKVGMAEYSRHVMPTVANAGNMGATMQEAFSLPAGMANAMKDRFGRESSTGAESLISQVRVATERFPEMQGKGFDERLAFLNSDDPRGIQARLGMTGVFDKEAKKYGRFEKGTLTGSQGAEATMLSILNQQGEGWNQYQDSRSKAPDAASALKFAKAKEAELSSLQIQQIARADLAAQQKVEAVQLEGGRAEAGVAGKTFDQLLEEQQGINFLDRKMAQADYYARTQMMGQDPKEAGAVALEDLARSKRGGAPGIIGPNEEAAESLERSAAALREVVNVMRGPTPNGPPPLTSGAK